MRVMLLTHVAVSGVCSRGEQNLRLKKLRFKSAEPLIIVLNEWNFPIPQSFNESVYTP
jgi:hypothetical protein